MSRQIAKERGQRAESPAVGGQGLLYGMLKVALDRLVALVAFIVLIPLLAAIAIIIRIDSPGNPLFLQERTGKGGRKFVLVKFRSMHVVHDDTKHREFLKRYVLGERRSPEERADANAFDRHRDPRITRVGAIIRKTNLDELPQLWNIMKGEMSFVGPRPDISFAVDMYEKRHRKRLAVTPGLTGLWQVSGRKFVSFEEMIRLDLEYIARQSLLLDAKIVLLTVRTVLRGEGS